MKTSIRLILLAAVLAVVVASLTFSVSASSGGDCGENLTWTLSDTGVFTLTGTGDMAYFPYGRKP